MNDYGIKLLDMHKHKPNLNNLWEVRVDRGSFLGNPYHMNGDESKRDSVIDMYFNYFEAKRSSDRNFSKGLDRLFEIYLTYGKLHLYCWCYPKRCHGEVIRSHLLSRLGISLSSSSGSTLETKAEDE